MEMVILCSLGLLSEWSVSKECLLKRGDHGAGADEASLLLLIRCPQSGGFISAARFSLGRPERLVYDYWVGYCVSMIRAESMGVAAVWEYVGTSTTPPSSPILSCLK